ncbi:MAG: hypothetical protein RMI89_07195 [Gloeomargarita sp. SKYBB_i_bin120]|nr:hypothetical protein [Gloeomargarita sp. SKYB120]MDW8178307.1 hypothetical protein [Gloeomargarita sp. SKYBB_i_bin120]
MARWTDEMLDRLAEQVQANAAAIRELREGQALMMQVIQRQENRIEELRQDTRNIHADIRQLLAILTRNYPNGRQDTE